MEGFQILRIDDEHFECFHCGINVHINKRYVKNARVCKECHLFNRQCNYLANKRRDIKRSLKYNKKNKKKINGYVRKYSNTEKGKKKIREYKSSEKFKEYINRWFTKQYRTNIQFKLKTILRSRLRDALKNNQKKGSAVCDLGCTIDYLKIYLESKFQPGMSWENYGLYGWHIDHIKPLSKFNLYDREELLMACHYTNLQPLWAVDNLKKKDS